MREFDYIPDLLALRGYSWQEAQRLYFPIVMRMPEEEFIPLLCGLIAEYSYGRHLDACDMVDEVQQIVHERGEAYLLSV